ncbi:hypothetical protein HALLA_10785 [Halostagnicola larsenii XH-48]|uniref:DUF7344 domain-containing protein n=1 Tax=Halostagnicola larsenii XH-48 TaxID=797299 RepID=W0JQ29_9EURY|nr:hypothetical protein [Halostagnicola larsenii]AHF99269.1 hypothetical protein HALLA_10785 [Halostagnicola larsenii XH-48]
MSIETANPSHRSDEPADSPPSPESGGFSSDMIFHILQTSRRRETIRYLLDADGPVKMRDVAEHVAAVEHDTTVANLDSTQRQRVYIPLYQSHLPTLDEESVIDYNKSRGIVHPTDNLEVFRPHLEIRSDDRSGSQFDEEQSLQTDENPMPVLIATIANVLVASIIGGYAAMTATNVAVFLLSILGVVIVAGTALWTATQSGSRVLGAIGHLFRRRKQGS